MNEPAAVSDYILAIVLFGVLALFTHWLSYKKGFFELSPEKKETRFSFLLLAAIFFIYIAMSLVIGPIIARWALGYFQGASPLLVLSILQIAIFTCAFLLMVLISYKMNWQAFKRIWKDPASPSSLLQDFGAGVLTLLISFPLVIAVSQVGDLFIYLVFNVQNYEQSAVRYLKMAMDTPLTFGLAMFTVLILAPLIEELLFRGFLQTWLKDRMGRKAAILIASFFFALFHLAKSQGVGNISLFISLFTLACYLGFIYEKQGSLMASIGLHMTFNAISTVRILMS